MSIPKFPQLHAQTCAPPKPSGAAGRAGNWLAALSLLFLCLAGSSVAQEQKSGTAKPSSPPAQKTAAQNAPQQSQRSPAVKSAGQTASAEGTSNLESEGPDFLREREAWFYEQRAYPQGFIPSGARLKALEHVRAMEQALRERSLGSAGDVVPPISSPGPLNWTEIGPGPTSSGTNPPATSGRVEALVLDPRDATNKTILLGAAQGGVWRTTDGGSTWTPVFDQQASLAMGAIGVAPSSPNIVYAGTGEDVEFVGDTYYGAGVFKSTDGGLTWTQTCSVPSATCPFIGPYAANIASTSFTSYPGGGARIGAVAVNPTNPSLVLVAAQIFPSGLGLNPVSGIYCSDDGGATWGVQPLVQGAVGRSVVYGSSTLAYASIGENSGHAEDDVYKSTNADGGVAQKCANITWTRIHGSGMPAQGSMGYIQLGLARSNTNTLYASIADTSTGSSTLLGIFKTTDGGTTWSNTSAPDFCMSQCQYDNVLSVNPTNPNIVIAGGSATGNGATASLIRTLDGGATWTQIGASSNGQNLHPDVHALIWGADSKTFYVGNDGGVWGIADATAAGPLAWNNLNSNLAITQPYPGQSESSASENFGLIGTQDNSPQRFMGSLTWESLLVSLAPGSLFGGDGGYTAIDPLFPTTDYVTLQGPLLRAFAAAPIFKSVQAAASTTALLSGTGVNPSDRLRFIPPLVHDPNTSGVLYFGTFVIYQSRDGANTWTAISPDLSGNGIGRVSAIAVSEANSDVVYAGTDTGQVQRTTNASAGTGAVWTNLTKAPLPNRTVSAIEVDHKDPNTVYVTFSGFSGLGDQVGHVMKSINGGASWTDISCTVANCKTPAATDLPNTPTNSIALDKDKLNTIYAGTDVGVFVTTDGGATWAPLGSGLPRVAVFSLTFRRASRILRAATHGRSVFVIQLTNVAVPPGPLLSSITPSITSAPGTAFTMTLDGFNFTATSVAQWDGSTTGVTTHFISANQLTADISASLLTTGGQHNITVFDNTQNPTTSSSLVYSILNAAPTLNSISPSSGSAYSAVDITASGSGFASGATLLFNGTAVPGTVSNGGATLTAHVPASLVNTNGFLAVDVANPLPGGGPSGNPQFFQVNATTPTLNSISPSSVVAGSPGFLLTLNGSAFETNSLVNFGANQLAVNFVSTTQLTVPIPSSLIMAPGNVNVTVSNGNLTSGGVTLTVMGGTNPVPTVNSAAPSPAPAGAAFTLTVNGANFVPGSVVNINGNARSTSFVSGTQLTAAILASDVAATGNASVTVVNPAPGGGTSSPALNLPINNPAPTINSLSPSGANTGGAAFTLIVNGTGFDANSVVSFNGNARATTLVNSTQVTANILASDLTVAGSFPVQATNPAPGGGASNSPPFTVTSQAGNPVPSITSLVPSNTGAGGAAFNLTVNGTNFIASSVVNFNGNARTTTFVSGTQLTAAITAADIATGGVFPVTVFNPAPGGGTSGASNFTVNNPAPTISSLVPNSVTAGGAGFNLTVNGAGFVLGSGSVVNFNGSPKATTFVNGNQLTAAITAADISTAGIFAVTVTNPAPGGGTSAASNFTVNNPAPTIVSLVPNNTLAGGAAFALTVNGTNFVAGSVVSFNGNARTTTFVNGTQLTAAITAADIATAGVFPVTVTNPAPGGGTSAASNFTVNNSGPTITSLVPNNTLAGGAAFVLTVNGTNFVAGSVVNFNGNARTTTFVNGTQLTAAITAGDIATAGVFPVTVTNPAPGGGTSAASNFTVNNPAPTITSLVPNNTLAGGAAFVLTVNGTNFVAGSVVNFNGNARTTTFVSGTQVTAAITAADIATGGVFPVTVTNPAPGGGTSAASNFTVNNPAPAITSLAPTNTLAGGAAFNLTVNGTGFVATSVVKFNGNARNTTFVNGTQLTAAITAADIATAGVFPITVTNPAPGGGTSAASNFTVNNPAPTITSLVPNNTLAGGAAFNLTVNGTGFVATSVVNFNGNARTTTFVSGTQLTAAITAADIATAGIFPVTVTNPAPGGGTSAASNFTVNNPAPNITSLNPSSVAAQGGAFNLTVNGTGFVATSVVSFSGNARTTTFVSSVQLTAAITAADIAAAGNANVTVNNPAPGGGTSTASVFVITSGPNPVPTLASIAPSSTTAGGAAFNLTVNGTNFVASSVVNFNGNARTTTFVSSIQLTAAITAADIATAGVFPVTVFSPAPGGGTSSTVNFTVNNPAPAITSLAPANAIAGGAAFNLTVNGTGFVATSVVSFNGNARTTTFVNANQLTAAIPAGDIAAAGAFPVTVTSPAPGGGTSAASNFTVNNPAPVLASLVPSSTTAAGAAFVLTVNGSGFLNGAVVQVNGSARVTTFVNSNQVTAAITAADIATAGMLSITATNPSSAVSNALILTVNNPAPTISSLVPNSATAGGAGFNLTVNGAGFVLGSGSVVNFNGNAKATTFVNANQLTAAITAADIATAGNFAVTVTNPAPGGGTSAPSNFTVNNPAPTLTSISPNSGTLNQGVTLTLTGTGYNASSVVNFGANADAGGSVSNGGTTLTINIPANQLSAVGPVAVTVTNPAPGGGTSAAVNFTVNNPAPTITSLAPNSATAGGAAFNLTVNGTGFVASSVVKFNGNARTTTFVNGTQLTAAITAGDIATAGVIPVTVTNPAPGGGTSAASNFTVNNPAPTITSLAPNSATAGGAAFNLTVNGTGFVATSVVNFNGNARTTTFVNANQLTAAITAADIATAGTFPVTVTNPAPGGGTSAASNFTVNNPAPTITSVAPPSTPAGTGFNLTVNGTNFVASSVVSFNNKAESTTFVSAGQLTAAIPAADVSAPGSFTVSVNNPAPGGGTGNSATNVTLTSIGVAATTPNPITAGGAAMITVTVTAQGTFNNPVSFSVSGLPLASTGLFSPASVTPGNGMATSTLTVQTTLRGALPPKSPPLRPRPLPLAWPWLGAVALALMSVALLRQKPRFRRYATCLPLAAALIGIALMLGCGGGHTPTGTPAGSYNLTITATSGSFSKTTNVTMVVN